MARHEFYARFPAVVYRKLRKLAGMKPIKIPNSVRKPLLLRLPLDTHSRLRALTLQRSTEKGDMLSMQEVLSQLIETSSREPDKSMSMVQVVMEIVMDATAEPRYFKKSMPDLPRRRRPPRVKAPVEPDQSEAPAGAPDPEK